MTRITEEMVGDYFVDEEGEVWRLIAYQTHPTALFEKVKPDSWSVVSGAQHRQERATAGLNRLGFRRLVPEGDERTHRQPEQEIESDGCRD